jgi:outer membrane lipoprotein-sorting protein
MDLSGSGTGPWRDALALLEAGFPRSRAQLEAQYDILALSVTNGVCAISLRPKSASARKLMPRISIEFSVENLLLRATELELMDGSSMRNEFSNAVLNPTIDPALFAPEIPPDYKVEEPLKRQ